MDLFAWHRWSVDAASLEQTIGQYLVLRRRLLLPRVVPFLRAQFVPFRVAMRTAVMYGFQATERLQEFLLQNYAAVIPMIRHRHRDPGHAVDAVIAAVDDLGIVPQFIRHCAEQAPVTRPGWRFSPRGWNATRCALAR